MELVKKHKSEKDKLTKQLKASEESQHVLKDQLFHCQKDKERL